jgi:hypothetical protein
MIITHDAVGLIKLNDKASQLQTIIQNVLTAYSEMELEPLNSMDDFTYLVSQPEQFVRQKLVDKMDKTISGIKLSEEKLMQLIELPDNYSRLANAVDNYNLILTRVLDRPKLGWFSIENNKALETDFLEADRYSFTVHATTPLQIQRMEAFQNLRIAILEAREILGDEIITGLAKHPIIKPTGDFSDVVPNTRYIL